MQYFCGRLYKISQQILVKHINCHVQRENSVTFLYFRISQGSSNILQVRWKSLCMYVDNFPTNHLLKEFRKSVHFAKVIVKYQEGILFWDTVYVRFAVFSYHIYF